MSVVRAAPAWPEAEEACQALSEEWQLAIEAMLRTEKAAVTAAEEAAALKAKEESKKVSPIAVPPGPAPAPAARRALKPLRRLEWA